MKAFEILAAVFTAGVISLSPQAYAASSDPVFETCPSASDVGDNVACYPVTFTSKTEIHPEGIPIIGYLFVPKDRPAEPLPAIVFAHGSGSMYSSGNHNKGLNSKHIQWVRQYTNDRGIVTFHVSSFHSRYMLPDSLGDQRIIDWEAPPEGVVGGDDYRATSTVIGLFPEDDDVVPAYEKHPFDPELAGFNDHNGRAGISEIIERPYDLDAAYDYLAGIINGTTLPNARGETLADAFTSGVTQKINALVLGLVIDPERVFAVGTSHGGQTLMGLAHKPRATDPANPMGNHPRYAAYFDFYGGCSLYGAYGGADADSTWLPVGPFLMLHGELDDIWTDGAGATTRERWENGECAPRIDAARSSGELNVLLETILLKNAAHSFSGAEPADGNDWYAKLYSDYEIVLPLMDAIGWITWARRSGAASVPNLADFGFIATNSTFSTFPLTPSLPPYMRSASDIAITDLRNFNVDLNTIFAERTQEGALAYFLLDNDHTGQLALSGAATLEVNLDDGDIAALEAGDVFEEATLQIINAKGKGSSYVSFEVIHDGGNAGTLRFLQGVRARDGGTHTTEVSGGKLHVNLHGLFATEYTRTPSRALSLFEMGGFDGGLALDWSGNLTGTLPTLPKTVKVGVRADGQMPIFNLTLTAGDAANLVDIALTLDSLYTVPPVTPEVELPDFGDLTITPGVPSSGPLTLDGSSSGWDHTPSGDGGDGGDGGNGGDSGNGGGGDSGSGGGGAAFWLLPFALLLRRR